MPLFSLRATSCFRASTSRRPRLSISCSIPIRINPSRTNRFANRTGFPDNTHSGTAHVKEHSDGVLTTPKSSLGQSQQSLNTKSDAIIDTITTHLLLEPNPSGTVSAKRRVTIDLYFHTDEHITSSIQKEKLLRLVSITSILLLPLAGRIGSQQRLPLTSG